jgi:hypothetical protein
MTRRESIQLIPVFVCLFIWVFLLIGLLKYAQLGKQQQNLENVESVEFRALLIVGAVSRGNLRLYDDKMGFENYACYLLPSDACINETSGSTGTREVVLEGKRLFSRRSGGATGLIVEATKDGEPWIDQNFILTTLQQERDSEKQKAIAFLPCTLILVLLCRWHFKSVATTKLRKPVNKPVK